MAAAQRRRKKTQHQQETSPRGRRSPAKQRSQHKQNRHTRRKPALKKSSHGKKSSFNSRSSKTLKQLRWGNRSLSSRAKGLMINFMNDIYKRVSVEAERLRKQSRRSTIGPTQMQAALREVMLSRMSN